MGALLPHEVRYVGWWGCMKDQQVLRGATWVLGKFGLAELAEGCLMDMIACPCRGLQLEAAAFEPHERCTSARYTSAQYLGAHSAHAHPGQTAYWPVRLTWPIGDSQAESTMQFKRTQHDGYVHEARCSIIK